MFGVSNFGNFPFAILSEAIEIVVVYPDITKWYLTNSGPHYYVSLADSNPHYYSYKNKPQYYIENAWTGKYPN